MKSGQAPFLFLKENKVRFPFYFLMKSGQVPFLFPVRQSIKQKDKA